MIKSKQSLLSLLVLPVFAFANGDDGTVVEKQPMEILAQQFYAGSQCGNGNNTSAVWIANQEQLKHFYEQLQKGKIGGPTQKLPDIDFKKSGGLLVNMGQKRTGGYGIKLLDGLVNIKDGIASVRIHWLEPSPGGIQIQVLTSPCVLIGLPINAYTQIKIIDQTNTQRAEVKIQQ